MRCTFVLSCLAIPVGALAQTAAPATPQTLPPVVVTATRTEVQAFDAPASISRIGSEEIRNAKSLVNISEDLGAVPGLLARDRQNYAQDVQISVRGFGARSTFGIRGVRLYVDGVPATLPDGQGQITNVELGSVGRIEVLRGPFSALYGNSAGGVIQVFTEEGTSTPRMSFDAATGSDGLLRIGGKAVGTSGGLGFVVSASRFHTDGYRDHSSAERKLGNAKFTLRPDDSSKLTLVLNSVALPDAQDPLGLSRAQFSANPRGVDPSALNFNTRKSVNQTQLGLIYERRLNAANSVTLMVYGGHRGTEQYQSIPTGPQLSATHPGGVINLARDYQGTDLRWTLKSSLLDAPFTLVAGVAYDALDEHRMGNQNFIGSTLGVLGARRRDENNTVASLDEYLQAGWHITPRFSLNAGMRHSQVRFRSQDSYIVGANPDDSGSTRYGATLPVIGALYALSPAVHLYATAGRGFETPTLNELAYRPGGQTGLNFALQAATSNSVEAGIKTRLDGWGELTAAAFQTRTRNEIVTLTNAGGRTTFQNAGGTRRNGLELGWSVTWLQSLKVQAAATLLNARYSDGFQAIPAGRRIPGIARGAAFASLGWAPVNGLRAGLELRHLSSVYVNDANSDAAEPFTIAAANVGYVYSSERWEFSAFLRGDNLGNKTYAGSVIVNEGNSRFFEPAPGRTWLLSTSATMRF